MALSAAAETKPQSLLDVRVYKLRNTMDAMPKRATEYFEKGLVPAVKRAGGGPVGVFQSLIAPETPFIVTVMSFPNLAAYEATTQKVMTDQEFAKAREAAYSGGLPYVRYEASLLRGFPGFPNIVVPDKLESGSRIFEVRTYESNTLNSLHRKIKMFDEGEVDIFRKSGMTPVYFGETIIGRNMPNLTYMLGYDSLAAREKSWSSFVSSPEWKKMSSQPGVSDAEIVSNISNIFVRPLAFSDIR